MLMSDMWGSHNEHGLCPQLEATLSKLQTIAWAKVGMHKELTCAYPAVLGRLSVLQREMLQQRAQCYSQFHRG